MGEVTSIAEQEVSVEPKPTWREIPKSDPAFEKYFKNYTSTKFAPNSTMDTRFKNLIILNPTFLFQDNSGEFKHIIWESAKEIGHDRIGRQPWWEELQQNPDVLEKINRDLLELSEKAKEFYPWSSGIEGFVIVNDANFGMNPGNGEGLNVNYDTLIKYLVMRYREGNSEKVLLNKVDFAAQMVHEMTHVERTDAFSTNVEEIIPHIPQFLFDPENNHIFNKQLKRALDDLKTRRDQGKLKEQYGYNWSQYTALLLTAGALAEQNPEFKKELEEDTDPSKIEALKKVIDLAGLIPLQTRKDMAAFFIRIPKEEVLQSAKDVEDKLGVTSKLV